MSEATFYWYDYEAFGLNPMTDRLSQFAGVRTDMDLNIVGEPLMIYCKPADDFLPSPTSCLITHITPQKALAEGVSEAEFARRIEAELSVPGTCALGYNSLNERSHFKFPSSSQTTLGISIVGGPGWPFTFPGP